MALASFYLFPKIIDYGDASVWVLKKTVSVSQSFLENGSNLKLMNFDSLNAGLVEDLGFKNG